MACDYMLFLNSDMVFPRTTLHRLLVHRKDIVGAIYAKRVPPYALLGTALEAKPTCDEHGLTEMKRVPTGCLLIRMAVFEALSKPYFRFLNDETSGEIVGEDYVFCDRAREAKNPHLVRCAAFPGDRPHRSANLQSPAGRERITAASERIKIEAGAARPLQRRSRFPADAALLAAQGRARPPARIVAGGLFQRFRRGEYGCVNPILTKISHA